MVLHLCGNEYKILTPQKRKWILTTSQLKMPKRINFLSFVLLKYVSITTSSPRSCKTPTHPPRGNIFLVKCVFFFFFFGASNLTAEFPAAHRQQHVWLNLQGGVLLLFPRETGGGGGNKKKINPCDTRAIDKLFTMPCGERLQKWNEKKLQTVPKFTPQTDDVTILCHDSTTQLTVSGKKIWMSPTSTRPTFIQKWT